MSLTKTTGFLTITNRAGMLVIGNSDFTEKVKEIVEFYDIDNASLASHEDVISSIEDTKDELSVCESFEMATAIFLNAKNYLLDEEGEDEIIDFLEDLGVNLYFSNGCYFPCGITRPIMHFISKS